MFYHYLILSDTHIGVIHTWIKEIKKFTSCRHENIFLYAGDNREKKMEQFTMKFTKKEIESNRFLHNRDNLCFIISSDETVKIDCGFAPVTAEQKRIKKEKK